MSRKSNIRPPSGKPGGGSRAPDKQKKKKGPEKETEWQLPAFGINPPKKKPAINWEQLKKDTARRQAPKGEDGKEIKRTLTELRGRDVPVQEFIALISPYTGDTGEALRQVMAEDLEAFRKLAKKVYETMTQDVSDVLVNEQLQMVQFYTEKHEHLTDKMMRYINETYEMVPNFDFEKFLEDQQKYLNEVLPLPAEIERDEAEYEMRKRQAAYHRLQWLRSEGERMNEENKRLQKRLNELKQEQSSEQDRAADLAAEAETRRQQLIEQETQIKDKIDKLNESVEKVIVENEATVTKAHNKSAKPRTTGAIPKKPGVGVAKKKKKQKRPEWASTVAEDIEEQAVQAAVADEQAKTPPPQPRGRRRRASPHFSPIKSPPPREAPKPSSPFHYSPPREPQRAQRQASPFHYSPPREAAAAAAPPPDVETRIQTVTTTVQQNLPTGGRRGTAPRDSWGGFY